MSQAPPTGQQCTNVGDQLSLGVRCVDLKREAVGMCFGHQFVMAASLLDNVGYVLADLDCV